MVDCPGGTIYTIKPGDSLYGLSRRFNITAQEIIEANPSINPTNLQLGQQICIPVVTTGPCPGGYIYTIKPGDTVYSISRRAGIAPQALVAANPGLDPDRLQIGQEVCVPAPPPSDSECPAGSFQYQIKSGDTLYSLARRYNTTVTSIIDLNPGINPNSLAVGQLICIPRSD